jgi:hypothetical protein
MTSIADLFARLTGDSWRVAQPFSDDILQANALLHNTAATDAEMAECATLWCLRRQPCQFGRVAASADRIHFCFLTERSLSEWTDEEIAEKIAEEKQLWKQRAVFDPLHGAHSFVLVVSSPRVAFAAPDQHLRAFSDRVLELAGWEVNRRGARRKNTVTGDFLYLRNPTAGEFFGFRFNIDFFACAGDGRWWQDHRFPGGIAFTANSTGHMIALREWYEGKVEGTLWALKQAMFTINNAAATRETDSLVPSEAGRATWLRSTDGEGNPLILNVRCPLSKVPKGLEGKDWTRYEGVLHTDHAVREEFFQDRSVAPTASRPYLMDFTYLYDEKQPDFTDFTGGKPFAVEQIFEEIGRPEDWSHREAEAVAARSREETITIAEQLEACRSWAAAFDIDEGSTI